MKTKVLEQPVEILTLAQRIGTLHREIQAQPGRYTEMNTLLTHAKTVAGDGGWLKWLADNQEVLGFGERQAQRYLRSPDLRKADAAANREDVAAHRGRQSLHIVPAGQQAEPDGDLIVDEAEDEKTIKVLPETEPPVTKQNTVKAPTNESPAPKKLKRGSRPWLKARVRDLGEVVRDLREAVPELTRPLSWVPDHGLFEDIVAAGKALGHIKRIAANPVEVKAVSLALVNLWNQQKGEQLKGKYCSEYLMSKVNEAVACELDLEHGGLDQWDRVIQEIARKDPSWFTRENFSCLIETSNGMPSGLEGIGNEFGALEAPETAGNPMVGTP